MPTKNSYHSTPNRAPVVGRLRDAFESVQRHVLMLADGVDQTMVAQLTPLQRQILSLLKANTWRLRRLN